MVKIDLCHVVISTVNPILFFLRSVVCTMQYIECHWQSRHVYTDASTTLSRETGTTTQLSSVSSTSTTTYLSTTATSPASLPSTTEYLPSKTTLQPSTAAELVSYGKLLIAKVFQPLASLLQEEGERRERSLSLRNQVYCFYIKILDFIR